MLGPQGLAVDLHGLPQKRHGLGVVAGIVVEDRQVAHGAWHTRACRQERLPSLRAGLHVLKHAMRVRESGNGVEMAFGMLVGVL